VDSSSPCQPIRSAGAVQTSQIRVSRLPFRAQNDFALEDRASRALATFLMNITDADLIAVAAILIAFLAVGELASLPRGTCDHLSAALECNRVLGMGERSERENDEE